MKYLHKGGITVDVRLRDTDSPTPLLTISVTDTGPGIADHQIPLLFKQFSQVCILHREFADTLLRGLTPSRANISAHAHTCVHTSAFCRLLGQKTRQFDARLFSLEPNHCSNSWTQIAPSASTEGQGWAWRSGA